MTATVWTATRQAPSAATRRSVCSKPLRLALILCQRRLAMNDRERARDLYERAYGHEMQHDLVPARQLLEEALAVASAAGASDLVGITHQLLGVVDHKEDRLDEAGFHLEEGLRLAFERGDRQQEAYARQELGFLLLDRGDSHAALTHFCRSLAFSPGVGIVHLAGNALNGMGVALLDFGRVDGAVPLLHAALAVRTEIGDLETARRPRPSGPGCPGRWRSQDSGRGSQVPVRQHRDGQGDVRP